jgi:hypothetical protein
MTEAVDTGEPRIQDLKKETLRSLRVVLRNLAEIRRITGIGEIVNLGRFLGEVGMREKPATIADARLDEAVERGDLVRRKLIQAEGGSLSAGDAAKELGMSKVAILKRYRKGHILAWREERQNAVRFPAWQFKNGRLLAGLEAALLKLNAGSRLDDFGRMLFFLSNSRFLGGKRPLDCLREGELHKVLQAAEGYGQ